MYVFHTVLHSILQQTQPTEKLWLFFNSYALHINQPVRTPVVQDAPPRSTSNFSHLCGKIPKINLHRTMSVKGVADWGRFISGGACSMGRWHHRIGTDIRHQHQRSPGTDEQRKRQNEWQVLVRDSTHSAISSSPSVHPDKPLQTQEANPAADTNGQAHLATRVRQDLQWALQSATWYSACLLILSIGCRRLYERVQNQEGGQPFNRRLNINQPDHISP